MTRKHFQMIANVVKNIDDHKVRHAVAMDFALRLKGENPRFSVSKFVGACNSYATVEAAKDEVQF
ncbi:MAG: hypothetical protein F3745_00010 [Nitrospinae bacterium]|nr:hypothetical protein [Nitrospinota bacterium]